MINLMIVLSNTHGVHMPSYMYAIHCDHFLGELLSSFGSSMDATTVIEDYDGDLAIPNR